MKEYLRDGVIFEELENSSKYHVSDLKVYKHIPNKIAGLLYEDIFC